MDKKESLLKQRDKAEMEAQQYENQVKSNKPPAGRTAPDTVYKCAVRNGL